MMTSGEAAAVLGLDKTNPGDRIRLMLENGIPFEQAWSMGMDVGSWCLWVFCVFPDVWKLAEEVASAT